jgi:hypothetical protein
VPSLFPELFEPAQLGTGRFRLSRHGRERIGTPSFG